MFLKCFKSMRLLDAYDGKSKSMVYALINSSLFNTSEVVTVKVLQQIHGY